MFSVPPLCPLGLVVFARLIHSVTTETQEHKGCTEKSAFKTLCGKPRPVSISF